MNKQEEKINSDVRLHRALLNNKARTHKVHDAYNRSMSRLSESTLGQMSDFSNVRYMYKYELAITVIIKNEGEYLAEWLDYHILAGVEMFYIYDNGSTDNTLEILKPYIADGFVKCIYFPDRNGGGMQLLAYNDAIVRFRYECRYMAVIDADEFIVPEDGKTITETLDFIAEGVENIYGITANWRVFMTCGYEHFDGGVIATHTLRPEKTNRMNSHVKSIVNPRRVRLYTNPHSCIPFMGLNKIDEHHNPVSFAFDENNTTDYIRINHYLRKSIEDIKKKSKRGAADHVTQDPQKLGMYNLEKWLAGDVNDVVDFRILHYIESRKNSDNLVNNCRVFNREYQYERFKKRIMEKPCNELTYTLEELLSYMRGLYVSLNDANKDTYIKKCSYILKYKIESKNINLWEMDYLLSFFLEMRSTYSIFNDIFKDLESSILNYIQAINNEDVEKYLRIKISGNIADAWHVFIDKNYTNQISNDLRGIR